MGSQIFECIGLSKDVVDRYFTNTVSRVGGSGIKELEKTVDDLHSSAFDPLGLNTNLALTSIGAHKFRSGKEEHLYNPVTIHLLQESTRRGDYKLFKQRSTMSRSHST